MGFSVSDRDVTLPIICVTSNCFYPQKPKIKTYIVSPYSSQQLSKCLKKDTLSQLIALTTTSDKARTLDKVVTDYMAFLLIQGLLSQPKREFNIAEYNLESALVDNLVYSFVSELEKKTTELEVYSPSESDTGQSTQITTPIIFLTVGSMGLILFPPNLKAINVAGMSSLWSLRVGVRGSGQLASAYLKQWEVLNQNCTELDIDYALSGGLFIPYLVIAIILPERYWLRILPEFLLEGGVFLYCVLPMFDNQHPVDNVLRAKLRDGSIYYSGVRLTGYAITLISSMLMAAYSATMGYL